MGGVPVLMALAAMGIGYGWHPDGNGGVEYVIQIPPEKLDHVRQAGEITSSIPPEVQGRVSRVVVRVGDQPLQRQTPPRSDSSLAPAAPSTEAPASEAPAARLSLAQSDHSPVPIPEIRDSGAEPSRAPAAAPPASLGSASVLKPAPQSGGGSGFQFPRQNQQAAGGAAASSGRRTGAMAPPSTGGPSTEPTDTQDDSWYDLQGGQRQRSSSDPPSLQQDSGSDPSESGGSGFQPQPQPSTGSRSQPTSGGRAEGSSEPAPASPFPDRSSATRSSAQDSSSSSPQYTAPEPSASNAGHGNRSAPSDTTGNFGRMPERLQSSSGSSATGDRRAASGQSDGTRHSDRGAGSGFGAADSDHWPAGGGRSGATGDVHDSPSASPDRAQVDPQLSDREASALPPGAWSYDAHGRPIDREGYVLDSGGRRITPNRGSYDRGRSGGHRSPEDERAAPGSPHYPNPSDYPGSPRYPDSSRYPDRYAGGGVAAPDRWQDRGPAWPSEADRRYASTAPGEDRRRTEPPPAERPRSSGESSRDESSSEPDSSSTGSNSTEPRSGEVATPQDGPVHNHSRAPKAVAAQPLFNGLLLISFVANVYLAFWLRNLRHQFRELVAAKRVSTSGGSS